MRVLSPSVRIAPIAPTMPTGSARWTPGSDLADARNAHSTNTAAQLRAALLGPFDWLECDVRMRDGEPVTAHGRSDDDALRLHDWLRFALAGGRGVKFDVKEATALPDLLELLRARRVDQARVIVNVAAGGPRRLTIAQLQAIRTALPHATINLDPGPPPYDAACLDHVAQLARQLGGSIMVPLDAAFVTRDVVQRARRAGRVAIWNDPARFDPGLVETAERRLRSWGVDGMVDLRRPARSRSAR